MSVRNRDRSMTLSANGNAYTLTLAEIPEGIQGLRDSLEVNASAAIEYLSQYIRWKGTLDFVVRWSTENLEGWWSPSANGFAAYGGIESSGYTYANAEAISGIDANGDDYDIGTWISPYSTTKLTNYGEDVFVDPAPQPLGTPRLDGKHDFYSIFLHEVFHGLGAWSNAQHELSATAFDRLTGIENDKWHFIGTATKQYFGGGLPLADTGSRDHFSDSIPAAYNLNREYARDWERWSLTGLELSFLKDLGYGLTPEGEALLDTYPLSIDSVTRITAFDVTEDRIEIPDELTGILKSSSLYSISAPIYPGMKATKKEWKAYKSALKKIKTLEKKIGQTGDAFAYKQSTGEFFVDTNGTQKGFGEGGLLAVLENQPLLGTSNIAS
jgi:hypothetical protein